MNWVHIKERFCLHDCVIVLFAVLCCIFLYNCTDIFRRQHTYVANPNYLIDGNNYVQKKDIFVDDSTKHLVWAIPTKNINQDSLGLIESGRIITAEEFASDITGYYSVLITVLVGLFILFTLFSYFSLKETFKQQFGEKEDDYKEHIKELVAEKLRDYSVRQSIIVQLMGEVEESLSRKDEESDKRLEKAEENIKKIYKLYDSINSKDRGEEVIVTD